MGIGDRARELFNRLNPPVESAEEMFARQQAEARAEALATRLDHAKRLVPFINRLVLVTDFGSDWSSIQDEHAQRVASDIREVLRPDTPLGVSVHLNYSRTDEGRMRQLQAGVLLPNALTQVDFTDIARTRTVIDTSDFWLRNLVLETEETPRTYQVEPSEVGHIAIVSAMDLKYAHIGIGPRFYDGEAYILRDIGSEPTFFWESITDASPSFKD